MEKNTKKEPYESSLSTKEPPNTKLILNKLEEQNLLIKMLKEELKKAPWEKQVDTIRH